MPQRGVEALIAVVALVLPPLCVLARTAAFPRVRVVSAVLTGVAAVGWLLARIGVPNAVADAADSLAAATPWVVAVLWIAAAGTLLAGTAARREGLRLRAGA